MRTRREFVACAALAAVGTGCQAFKAAVGEIDWTALAVQVASAAARLGVSALLRSRPAARNKVEVAEEALAALLKTEDYDPAKFAAAIQGLGLFYGETGILLSGAAVSVFSATAGRWIDVQSKPALASVMRAVHDGLVASLASAAERGIGGLARVTI